MARAVLCAGALHACSTTPWSWGAVKQLRSLLVKAVWGKGALYGAPEVLLGLQSEPLDPVYQIAKQRLKWLWQVCQRGGGNLELAVFSLAAIKECGARACADVGAAGPNANRCNADIRGHKIAMPMS